MAIVVEVLARNNTPLKTWIFNKEEISIGRGYNNDVQLNDPYVCANHLHLSTDEHHGAVNFSDIESINGVQVNDKRLHTGTLSHADVITLGRTRLRISDQHREVPPSIRLSAIETKLDWLGRVPSLLALTAIYALMLITEQYQTTFEEFKLAKVMPEILAQMLVISIWPLLFALLAKLSKKESRIVSQLSLVWVFFIALNLLSLLNDIMLFNLADNNIWSWVEFSIFGAVIYALFWLTMLIAFHQATARRHAFSAGFTACIIASIWVLGHLNKGDFSVSPSYSNLLLPPEYNLSPPSSTQEFIQRSEKLFERLEEAKANDKNEE